MIDATVYIRPVIKERVIIIPYDCKLAASRNKSNGIHQKGNSTKYSRRSPIAAPRIVDCPE